MGPIAQKLLKELQQLQATATVTDLNEVRRARAQVAAVAEAIDADTLPPGQHLWMDVFKIYAALGSVLLGSATLRSMASRIEAAEEAYTPGGPPMSPVLDSAFVGWWMADLAVGPCQENLCSIVADLASVLRMPPELRDLAHIFAASHLDVFRATPDDSRRTHLTRLATGEEYLAEVAAGVVLPAGLWLGRLLPYPNRYDHSEAVLWGTPYFLDGPEAESKWRAYFDRQTGALKGADRLNRLARHFKGEKNPVRMLDFMMRNYGGQTAEGLLCLRGVPEESHLRPEGPCLRLCGAPGAAAETLVAETLGEG